MKLKDLLKVLEKSADVEIFVAGSSDSTATYLCKVEDIPVKMLNYKVLYINYGITQIKFDKKCILLDVEEIENE